ncbi:hypothetical protein [Muricoccus radiodurans]|uniref:hypothetical protein n=1 Tax=Muricoccus radiodurans TaxID=2231721 RepID=UPI003CE8EF73
MRSADGRLLAWVLAALLAALNIAGYVFDLYSAFWWFDRVLHAGTILALTFWLAILVFHKALRDGHHLLVLLLIASVGIAAGALWEVAEWAFDAVAPGNVIKGKDDTLIDVIMDTVGSFAAALLALRYRPGPGRAAVPLGEPSRVR